MQWLQSMTCAMRIIFKLESLVKVERHRLLHAHFVPSCGTASKARERLVPGLPKERQPRPLRSEEKPDGLDNLTSSEAARVTSANDSCEAAVRLILILLDLGFQSPLRTPRTHFSG